MKNRIEEITKHYYTGNHLSSTQLVTDGTGVAVQQVEYAPFGEVVNEYNIDWSNGQVPDFKFNAKELDEESGMYYFEARYQRPPVFISRDVLFERFPTFSPYSFCYNNPLTFSDPTGEAGVVKVNKKTKTLTVSATYYVVTQANNENDKKTRTYSPDEVKEMNQKINETLNKAKYKVTEGEYEGYSVIFDLKFVDAGHSYEADAKRSSGEDDIQGIPTANIMRRGAHGRLSDLLGDTKSGVTVDHNLIIMEYSNDKLSDFLSNKTRQRIHEIFHTLFFDNDDAEHGIGAYEKYWEKPLQSDINQLINNPKLQKIEFSNEDK